MRGSAAAASHSAGELLEAAKTYGLPAFEGYGATIASWAARDLQGVQAVINILESLNCNLILTYYDSFLADIAAEAGNVREAVGYVDASLARCARFDEHVFHPELLRRRAVLEMRLPSPDRELARTSLAGAREMAREHGQYRFETRAIQDQQRLFGDEKSLSERLAQIYDAFPDLTPQRVTSQP